MPFAPLPSAHVHPQSLDSACHPEAFAKREVELGTGTMTSTDHGTMAGVITVYKLALENGLTPILGFEGYVRDLIDSPLTEFGIDPAEYLKFGKSELKYMHFTCHYLDQAAYELGGKLLSKAPMEKHGSEEKPIFGWAELEELGGANVTVGSGCLIGLVSRHLMENRPDVAARYYEKYRALFKNNFYVEIFPHRCTHNWVHGLFIKTDFGTRRFWASKKLKTNGADEITARDLAKQFNSGNHTKLLGIYNNKILQELDETIESAEEIEDFLPNECSEGCQDGDVQAKANRFLIQLAKKYGDPVIFSDDSHYATADQKVVQDVRLAQSGNWKFYGDYSRQSSDQAFECFRDTLGWSEYDMEELIGTSRAWADRFKGFKLEYKPLLATKFYTEDTLGYFYQKIKEKGRFDPNNPIHTERLELEIERLHRNGVIDLLGYFFPMEDVVNHYNKLGIIVGPGRGSAPGAACAFWLGITSADPFELELDFDRFYNADRAARGNTPDIDMDFPTREPMIGKWETYLTVKMTDGTIRKYKETDVLNTDKGYMTVREAFKKKVEIIED